MTHGMNRLLNSPEVDMLVPFGSLHYAVFVLIVLFARGADLFSTWVATPTLELEANPIARLLGWRAGILVNVLMAAVIAILPLAAVSIATTSLMVAARNLQAAWIVRAVGEHAYRSWIAARYRETSPGVFLCLLILQTGFISLIGGVLMLFSGWQLVPFGVGFGIIVYAVAVALFTGISMRKAGKQRISRTETGVSPFAEDP